MSLTAKWIVAAAAAAVAGVLAVPILLGGGEPLHVDVTPGATSGEPAGAGCSDKKANLSFTLKDMHGADVRLSDYNGKVVLLNFWGTWCAPCRAEMPILIEMADKYRAQGLVVLGLAQQDTPEDLRAFAAEHKMNYPSLLSTPEIEDAFGPMFAVPMTFLVDRQGSICFKHMGVVTREQIEKAIKPLL